MKALQQLERIRQIIKLIKLERTGTPEEFASSMQISKRRLYDHLENFRDMGVEIDYSKQRNTYYFSNGHELVLHYSLKLISKEKEQEIYGGFIPIDLLSAFFVQGTLLH
jgi:hypothetical protein